jgi:predicted DNA-binding protein YlxM (UPF0122 family)
VSRNAVHKVIKSVEEKLEEYENKLKLYGKSLQLDKIIKSINDDDLKKKLEELK